MNGETGLLAPFIPPKIHLRQAPLLPRSVLRHLHRDRDSVSRCAIELSPNIRTGYVCSKPAQSPEQDTVKEESLLLDFGRIITWTDHMSESCG
jgi:hypothetical protein